MSTQNNGWVQEQSYKPCIPSQRRKPPSRYVIRNESGDPLIHSPLNRVETREGEMVVGGLSFKDALAEVKRREKDETHHKRNSDERS